MPFPVAPRVLVVVVAATLLSIGASLYIQTEFPGGTHRCYAQTFGVVIMTFDNRTYCGETVSVQPPPTQCPPSTGPTITVGFWGYTFALEVKGECLVGAVSVNVTEPNGSVFQGGPYFGDLSGQLRTTWFTPDNEAGVYEPYYLANVTLLVAVGN